MSKFLTIEEAAKLLGVAPITIRRWHLAGQIPSIRLGSKLVRIDAEKLSAMLDASGTDQGVK